MNNPRFAFVKAGWHCEVVDRALDGFRQVIDPNHCDVFDVPGAFELPLQAQTLARSGRYQAVVAAAFVVDGGIYRHDFVASAVVNGLLQVGLQTGVPVLSVCLTPHLFQETHHHVAIFEEHFVLKGREAAMAALQVVGLRDSG